ncbi:molybdopterin-dependent oxidoreductase [Nocardioides massiliensis]|uniref:Anaerobic selenocysteine-containing dehydrogenase n=1 Tax=Nocardioides massiliensis TaxID=1325935 RepID=A0ABT9NQC2_9ACTN|nr:molybdopterin-dependent oxidoreductase [Nocardioides massiliensis]MDP9822627.1 anaerobic selenocysteine-containing dehydrogenase [Nocardioides massiliensis]
MGETRIGVCNLCEAICGLEITVEGRTVTGIRGNPADPLSRGYVCPKGVSLADVYADPDRLRRPVRRVGAGAEATWVEMDWDEAYDLVAERLAAVIRDHGRNAVAGYLGNPTAHSIGAATHGSELLRVIGTRNRFSASSVDQIPHQLVAWQLYGHQLLIPIPDIDRTDYFCVFGANPMASNGSLMTVPDFPQRARDLAARGGRMVVFDPRRTETARIADEHHFVRPGTDAVVLLAMVRTILADGLARPAAYVDGRERLRTLVEPFTPERAETASGVPAATVRRVAREIATARSAAVYGRVGVSTQEFGSLCQWAIGVLNILTGNLDRPGGVLFPEPAIDVVGRQVLAPGHFDAWRSRVRGAPEFAGELPVAVLREEITTPGDGQVRALLTHAGNPVLSTPDGRGLADALDSLDFFVAVDIYVNETTRHADVILPPTTALERDHYDLVFHGLAVRNTARWTPAVLPRDPDQRHDWEIFRDVTRRLIAQLDRDPATRLPRAKRWRALARVLPSPATMVTAMLLRERRTSMRALRRRPEGVDLGPLRPTLPGRLQTPAERIDLTPELLVADLARLETALARTPVADDELLLIGRRHKQDCNSWLHNTERLTRGRPRHHLLMHPDDLAARGIGDGECVEITSAVGAVRVEVTATDDVLPGVVSLPHGYGHQLEGVRLGRASQVPGVSINDLTDPALLDLSGNAALCGVPVRVAAVPVEAATQPLVSPVG